MSQVVRQTYTPVEYLALEEAAEIRSEYDAGEIRAMAGGSRHHSLIIGNIHRRLHQGLETGDCEIHMSDMRLLVARHDLYTYPDVMIICGPVEFMPERDDTVTNPTLLIEVLSPSTREYDRVKKFGIYKTLPSLREYLLVDSERVHVTHLQRLSNGKWTVDMVNDLADVLTLESIGCTLTLQQIYRRLQFD